MEYSRWANTQATAEMQCPRCGQPPSKGCRTPKGRLTHYIHTERFRAYLEKIGHEEFDRRHSIGTLDADQTGMV